VEEARRELNAAQASSAIEDHMVLFELLGQGAVGRPHAPHADT
jgi:hypothetical protein